jgi:hypothetical protein
MWDLLSPIEYYAHNDAIDKKDQNEHSNNTQEYTLDTELSLYENQDKPVQAQQIDVLHDTGASITMLPSDFDFAWTNVRDSLHTISGCLKGTAEKYTQIGEFHALITLDTGEIKRAIIPEAILIPSTRTNTYLLAHAPLLMAGHNFLPNLYKPKIKFREGEEYIMTVRSVQIKRQHTRAYSYTTVNPMTHRHLSTMFSSQTTQTDLTLSTPTTLIYHLRYGCMSEAVLQHTQRHVIGMQVQQGSWKRLKQQLPCSPCLAGKMRKTNKAGNTTDKKVRPNEEVSIDWGIINKQALPNQNNVFALFLDLNTGLVFVFPSPSRGLTGTALLAYIQRYGQPLAVRHDNAQEFIAGEFTEICNKKGIQQNRSAPFNPNQNPVEQYMDLLMSKTRCLLATSGLDPKAYWELALEHSATLTNVTALPGRCTPSEHTFKKRPDISNLRIFGCDVLAYRETDKRTKLQPKVDQGLYVLETSPQHSDDTYRILMTNGKMTGKVLVRRQVYFNKRSFPAQKMIPKNPLSKPLKPDDGSGLIGLTFVDDGESFRVTGTHVEAGINVVDYKDKKGNQHYSTIKEVKQWIEKTKLTQAANLI